MVYYISQPNRSVIYKCDHRTAMNTIWYYYTVLAGLVCATDSSTTVVVALKSHPQRLRVIVSANSGDLGQASSFLGRWL